jgi:hypothetical protein
VTVERGHSSRDKVIEVVGVAVVDLLRKWPGLRMR